MAVMKFFWEKITKLSEKVKMFGVKDLQFQYGVEGDEVKNYWFSKNWWSNWDKIPFNCLFRVQRFDPNFDSGFFCSFTF